MTAPTGGGQDDQQGEVASGHELARGGPLNGDNLPGRVADLALAGETVLGEGGSPLRNTHAGCSDPKRVERLPDKLVACISEQPQARPVDIDDVPIAVDQTHWVRRVGEGRLEERGVAGRAHWWLVG